MSRASLYLAALAVVCSTVLMGERWLRFALFSFALFAPALALLYVALQRFDRFTLDDERGRIFAPGRGETAFSDINAVRVHELAGVSSWTVLTTRGPCRLLLAGSPGQDAAIREALESRASKAVFRESNTAGLWLWLGLLLTPVLLQEGFLYWLRERQPETSRPCPEESWGAPDRVGAAAADVHEIGPFRVSPPSGFKPDPERPNSFVGSDGAELLYEAEAFASEMSAGQAWLLRHGVGVRSLADAIRWAGCSQRAVLPMVAKAVLLEGDEARVVAFSGGAALVRGQSALVAIDSHDQTLTVRVSSPASVSETLISAVVAGVHAKRPGEP